jgi:hypothetical protein
MRSTADLIEELKNESDRFTRVALVVGFEASTEFVWKGDPEALEKLNSLVGTGGNPVGMIAYVFDPESVTYYTRRLEEYANEEWVENYLERLIGTIEEGMSAEIKRRKGKGWIN